MKRILVPSSSPASWRAFLADPAKHWRTGYSAKALAHAWEAAAGIPREITRAFVRSQFSELREIELVLAIPEYETDLPGGRRPTCTDVFVLARATSGLVSIAVEGKVAEEFGPLVSEWRSQASTGKAKRWEFIAQALGIDGVSAGRLRYQLFHRTVAAVLEGKRFGARDAALVVHSFSPSHAWYDDFAAFVEFMGGRPERERLIHLKDLDGMRLHAAWVRGPARFLKA